MFGLVKHKPRGEIKSEPPDEVEVAESDDSTSTRNGDVNGAAVEAKSIEESVDDAEKASENTDRKRKRNKTSRKLSKRLKLKDFKIATTRMEQIRMDLTIGACPEENTTPDDLYNTYVFHDDPNHKVQTDNILSVNTSPKDWFALFFTETMYEMMECQGDWETYGGSSDGSKIYLALLLQMAAFKLPQIVHYWQTDPVFNPGLWAKYMTIAEFVEKMRCEDSGDYCKTFVEAINGSLEEFCHSKITIQGRTWKGRVGVRRYYDLSRTKVEGSLYVLYENDGLILKILMVPNQSGEPSSVDIVMELMKRSSGFGKLLNRTDVYVGMDLALHPQEKNQLPKTVNGNWKMTNVEAKLVDYQETSEPGELLLINLVKTRDAMEEVDTDGIFSYMVEFGNLCDSWSKLTWSSRAMVDVMNLTVNAAYVLNSRCGQGKDFGLLEFRQDVVKSLLSEGSPDSTDPSQFVVAELNVSSDRQLVLGYNHVDVNEITREIIGEMESTRRLQIDQRQNGIRQASDHALILISEEKPRPRRRCRRCYKLGVRKETSYMCAACPNQFVLCMACHPLHVDEVARNAFRR